MKITDLLDKTSLKGKKCYIDDCPFEARMEAIDGTVLCAGHFMTMCVAMWAEEHLKLERSKALSFANDISDEVVSDILSKGLELKNALLNNHKTMDD